MVVASSSLSGLRRSIPCDCDLHRGSSIPVTRHSAANMSLTRSFFSLPLRVHSRPSSTPSGHRSVGHRSLYIFLMSSSVLLSRLILSSISLRYSIRIRCHAILISSTFFTSVARILAAPGHVRLYPSSFASGHVRSGFGRSCVDVLRPSTSISSLPRACRRGSSSSSWSLGSGSASTPFMHLMSMAMLCAMNGVFRT